MPDKRRLVQILSPYSHCNEKKLLYNMMSITWNSKKKKSTKGFLLEDFLLLISSNY